jgi:hypothetical protein
MHKLKDRLQAPLQFFDREVLWSPGILKEGVSNVAGWAIPAIIMVWLVDRYHEHIPSAYLMAAISEGISPHLWNVMGTLALVLTGLSFLFPRSKLVAKSACQILISTHAVGGLLFGLLSGQLATAFMRMSARGAIWKICLAGAGSAFWAILALLLNFFIWYLGYLMTSREKNDGFLHRVERVSLWPRMAVFVLLSGSPVAFLFMEK